MPGQTFGIKKNPEESKPQKSEGEGSEKKADGALCKREYLTAIVNGFDFPYLHAQGLAPQTPEVGKEESDLEIDQRLKQRSFVAPCRYQEYNDPGNEYPGDQE